MANGFELTINYDVSIDQLAKDKDISQRSAHVGNLSMFDMTASEAGIPILLINHNQTGKDKDYFPEVILTQAGKKYIAPLGRYSCRTIAEDLPAEIKSLCPNAQYVDDAHVQAMRSILKNSTFITNTEYLQKNRQIAQEILDLSCQDQSTRETFNKTILPSGIGQDDPLAANLIGTHGIMQMNDNPRAAQEAVLIPNTVDILINFVVEAMNSKSDMLYHLSAWDMVGYIKKDIPDLQRLYGLVRKMTSYGSKLPEKLTVQLVPAMHAKFATTKLRQTKLDKLISAYSTTMDALTDINSARADYNNPKNGHTADEKTRFNKAADEEQLSKEAPVYDAMLKIPELFNEPGSPHFKSDFLTQYDVAKEGGLYVHSKNRSLTMNELRDVSSKLENIKKRALKRQQRQQQATTYAGSVMLDNSSINDYV